MNTLDTIFTRKSTRAYSTAPVSLEAIETILKAGMAAPVANAGYDSLHLTVVRNEDILQELFARATEFVQKFGYSVDEEDAKEHHISVNWV